MSDLPKAREEELEQFADVLFPFVGLWTFWVRVYAGREQYYRYKAEAEEQRGGNPERALEYRRREKLYHGWAASVRSIAEPAVAFASLVAIALGGTFADGVFTMTAEQPAQ